MLVYSRRDVLRSAALASASLPVLSTNLFGQANYPAREIRSVCMFPPGSGADVTVRFYARKLSELAGQPVIVENKAGAFGNIATETVAKARPDGYTIYIAPASSVMAAAAHLFKKLPFDPMTDFEHVTTLARLPFVLFVGASSPFKTVAELTAHLKEKGDQASYGSVANTGLVGSEMYKAAFGLKTVEVKYRDPQAMLNDLMSGHITFVHLDPTSALGQMQSGRVRALATTAAQRMQALPDIPSAAEAGITGMDLTAWWSVHVPAKTPKPIVDKLEGWFNQIAPSDEAKQFLHNIGVDPFPGNSQMLKDLLAREMKAWGDYVKIANIQPL
jgi:tripartite-type tricarboxylate transporter receptor subunit TctC